MRRTRDQTAWHSRFESPPRCPTLERALPLDQRSLHKTPAYRRRHRQAPSVRRSYQGDRVFCRRLTRVPGRFCSLHLLVEIVQDLRRRKWSDLRRLFQRIADTQRLHLADKLALKLFVDFSGDDKTFRSDARLAVVDRARFDSSPHRLVEVGRGHDDERIAATELQDSLLNLFSRNR